MSQVMSQPRQERPGGLAQAITEQMIHDLEIDPVLAPLYWDPQQRCRCCGCTNSRPCPGGCGWAAEGLCTNCVSGEAA